MGHRLAEEVAAEEHPIPVAAEAPNQAAVVPKPPDRAVAVADPTGPRWRRPRQCLTRQSPYPRITP
jgi:hypothetical protein